MQSLSEALVLLVDDDRGVLDSYELTLESEGIGNTASVEDSRQVLDWLAQHQPAAVVLDLNMPHISGMDLLSQILSHAPALSVIVCTANDDVASAVRCMRMGAEDFLVKPVETNRFVSAVRNAIERWKLRHENELLRERLLDGSVQNPGAFSNIITQHPRMHAVFQYVEAVARTGRPLLIVGETGVGKELIARAAHELSGRQGRFVPVNIAGFDDTLLADTLFGHVRGAYTGAEQARPGLIEQARGGTLFLDEIGDLQPNSQVKLLRLLQEHEYLPLGADQPKRSDARVVVATHQDLPQMVADGHFRKDLFYRLSAHRVEIPPLRERLEDLPLLIQKFAQQASEEMGKPPPTIPDGLYALMRHASFPGNVRELQGMVFDSVARHQKGALSLAAFQAHLAGSHAVGAESGAAVNATLQSEGRDLPTLAASERQLIEAALARTGGNQTVAAQLLGISRTALIRRLKKLHE